MEKLEKVLEVCKRHYKNPYPISASSPPMTAELYIVTEVLQIHATFDITRNMDQVPNNDVNNRTRRSNRRRVFNVLCNKAWNMEDSDGYDFILLKRIHSAIV